MTKDPHPDPPLRSLPEHSVLDDADMAKLHRQLSGEASPHGLDKISGMAGAADNSSAPTTTNDSSAHQPAPGISTVDFAQSMGMSKDESKSNGGGSSEGLFFSPQGLTSSSNTSTTQQTSRSTSQYSSTQQSSSTSGQQIQSGRMTFTLPDFSKDDESKITAARDELLSPTQPQE
jgi:glycogenin glucosyltransferase